MTQKNTFTAEQALAALSFFSESFSFDRRQQPPRRSDESQAEEKQAEQDYQEWAQLEELIPDWIEEGDDTGEEQVEELPAPGPHEEEEKVSARESQSWLEELGPDLSALILSHLSVSELMNVTSFVSKSMYRACRTNELWRAKFVARWNYPQEMKNWFEAYKAAYGNSHDLWVTHWNCVSPNDGDSPGRCCISPIQSQVVDCSHENDANGLQSPWMKYCPTCRYASGNGSLPPIIQQAMDREERKSISEDLVDEAEVTAAAHALLLQEDDSLTSRARAIFATTQYAIAKWCRNERNLSATALASRQSRQAFENAATFHRRIEANQYRSNDLNFLTDVLFFSLVDSHLQQTRQGLEEKEHLHRDLYTEDDYTSPGAPNTVSSLGPSSETSHHSWHIVCFSNPDFVRPISFRIFVQRPDCFTVFPSEGFLMPGQTCHIVLGVRLLGSLLSEAFEALNVQREEVDPFLADVYAHEAHLPYAPFAIRYVFAPAIPCIPPSFTSRGGIKAAQSLARPAFTQAATSKYKDMREYLWENVATEATVRTLYLSAHVHANYRFEDFQRATLSPFEIQVHVGDKWGSQSSRPSKDPMVYVAPNLQQKDPTVYESLENLRLEMELSDAGQSYRTEKQCEACSRDWGPRSEELGRAYILQRLICDSHARRKYLLMCNVVTATRQIYTIVHAQDSPNLSTDLHGINGILYILHGVLVQTRADPSISISQRQYILRLECIVDELTRMVQDRLGDESDSEESVVVNDEEAVPAGHEEKGKPAVIEDDIIDEVQLAETPWRNVGVYRFRTCTDSVYDLEIALQPLETELAFTPILKDELDYLDGFRYLCHSPGIYCLGQQQDPNHEDPKILPVFDVKTSPFSRLIPSGKRSRNSDTFMDNRTLAFACALSMIHDPRSLLVHGIYDRVSYPGTISRRPKVPPSLFNRTSPSPRDALIERSSVLAKKWKSQNLTKSTGATLERYHKSSPILSKSDRRLCLHYAELDVESHALLHLTHEDVQNSWHHLTALNMYQWNIPPAGVGWYSLSTAKVAKDGEPESARIEIFPLRLSDSNGSQASSEVRENENTDWLVRGPAEALDPVHAGVGAVRQRPRIENGNQNVQPPPFMGAQGNGPRVVNLLWLMSAHFGWAVDETQGAASVLVDRKILIATQWVSNSLMTLPLLWTLLARYVKWITSKPINYYLEGLPHEVDNEMRYLTAAECGSAAVLVLALWLIMGRYAERRISRSFERAMMEHLSNSQGASANTRFLPRMASHVSIWFQRQWDRISPLFLQRLVFSPRWNHRNDSDVRNHVTAWRSKDLREHRSNFDAQAGQDVATYGASVEDGGPPVDYKEESPLKKILTGLVVSLGSFSASSPHFFLNLLTVFSCSIALVSFLPRVLF